MSGAGDAAPSRRAPRVLVAHPSAETYGSDLQLLESVVGLRDAGCEVTLCVPETGPLIDLVEGVADVRVAPFPVLRKALLRPGPFVRLVASMPAVLLRLARLIRTFRPDVVYVNTVTLPLWNLAARLARRPVLVHVHEAEEDVPRLVRVVLGAPLLLARRVVANSGTAARVVGDAVPRLRARTVVVVNGVPDHGVLDESAVRPGHVVLVGRLSPRKGTDVALDAVGLLRAAGRDVTITLCGTVFDGYEWFEQQLRERAARPDLEGAVEFAGYVSPTRSVLATAQAVLVPSRVEPFGNTAVEALLAGRPLVASAVQGLAEIVRPGRTGTLVPPDDARALADAVAGVLDDPDAARGRAVTGRDDAVRRFGLDRYRQRIVDEVFTVAGRDTPRPETPRT